jgi:hypothetical protein
MNVNVKAICAELEVIELIDDEMVYHPIFELPYQMQFVTSGQCEALQRRGIFDIQKVCDCVESQVNFPFDTLTFGDYFSVESVNDDHSSYYYLKVKLPNGRITLMQIVLEVKLLAGRKLLSYFVQVGPADFYTDNYFYLNDMYFECYDLIALFAHYKMNPDDFFNLPADEIIEKAQYFRLLNY